MANMGLLLAYEPDESAGMIAILVAIARSAPMRGQVQPVSAIDALLDGGEIGIRVLRGLHEDGTVREPGARVYLEQLARRDFVPQPHRPRG